MAIINSSDRGVDVIQIENNINARLMDLRHDYRLIGLRRVTSGEWMFDLVCDYEFDKRDMKAIKNIFDEFLTRLPGFEQVP